MSTGATGRHSAMNTVWGRLNTIATTPPRLSQSLALGILDQPIDPFTARPLDSSGRGGPSHLTRRDASKGMDGGGRSGARLSSTKQAARPSIASAAVPKLSNFGLLTLGHCGVATNPNTAGFATRRRLGPEHLRLGAVLRSLQTFRGLRP